MRYPDWNENENITYDRLSRPSAAGPDEQQTDSLAYTAVMEMYHQRKTEERCEAFKADVMRALDQVADGMCALERLLGVSLREMADRHSKLRSANVDLDAYFAKEAGDAEADRA